METIVIVVIAEGWDLQSFANALERSHRVHVADGKVLEVSKGASSAYVCVMSPWGDGLFEEWPVTMIPTGVYAAFSIDYRKHELAESIVRRISARVGVVVDTNFGVVLSGEDFLARVDRSESRWEWWHWPRDKPSRST